MITLSSLNLIYMVSQQLPLVPLILEYRQSASAYGTMKLLPKQAVYLQT